MPSHFISELERLLTLPATEVEPVRQIDLVRELMLSCLPQSVRAAIPHASTMPREELLKTADSLTVTHNASCL